jgi:hypothetical protein
MGLVTDRFVGTFEGLSIELVRTNLDKQIVILVDGKEVAHESVALPHTWDQAKEFTGTDGRTHRIVAHSMLMKLWGLIPYESQYAIGVDGQSVPLTCTE